MYLTQEEYKTLGYTKLAEVEESVFELYEETAEATVQYQILDRPFINATDEPSCYNKQDPIKWERKNKRGLCMIMDLQYTANHPETIAGGELKSFKNDEYSEEYTTTSTAKSGSTLTLEDKIQMFIEQYYTQSQRARGVY